MNTGPLDVAATTYMYIQQDIEYLRIHVLELATSVIFALYPCIFQLSLLLTRFENFDAMVIVANTALDNYLVRPPA
jgi:hypothetical protein